MKREDAERFFGGRRAMAEALGISVQSVQQWGEYVPELRSYHIEAVMREREQLNRKVG